MADPHIPPAPPADWRAWIAAAAQELRRTPGDATLLKSGAAHLAQHGFTPATASLAMAATASLAQGWNPADPQFAGALNLLLDGLEQRRTAAMAPTASVFVPLLAELMRNVRESAEVSLYRAAGLHELDRQLLLLIEAQNPRTQAELGRLTGRDKAQVNRSLMRLADHGMIAVPKGREPPRRLAAGDAMAARMLDMMRARNLELTAGLNAEDRAAFVALVSRLVIHARQIGEAEADSSALARLYGDQVDMAFTRGDELIIPPLFALYAYIQRWMAAAVRGLGLTLFDAMLLPELAGGGLGRKQLVARLGRDQSQAGKRVVELESRGLLERRLTGRGRRVTIALTATGEAVCDALADIVADRDTALLGDLAPPDLALLVGVTEAVASNMRALLAGSASAPG